MDLHQLVTATPADIDAKHIEIAYTIAKLTAERDQQYRIARSRYTSQADSTAAEQAMRRAADKVSIEMAVVAHLDSEFDRRGGWTRVWVVPGGHAHRTTGCHSLYADTQLVLYPALSGATEEQIVEAAGDRACTFCYPSAPVEKKSTIVLESEAKAEAERVEREQAKVSKAAAKAAKAITNPDGSPLRYRGDTYETEAAAQQRWVEVHADAEWNAWGIGAKRHEELKAEAEVLIVAIADKHGESVEQAKARLAPKIKAKAQRDQRAAIGHAKALGLPTR